MKDHKGFSQPDRAEEWAHRQRMRREMDPWSRRPGLAMLALVAFYAVLMLIAIGLSVIFAD